MEEPTYFTDEEIKVLTDDFSESRMVGREGSFGSVFKCKVDQAKFPCLPETVAVKVSKNTERFSGIMFEKERKALTAIKHRNIVQLLGYGESEKHFTLIYECALCDLTSVGEIHNSSELFSLLIGAATAVVTVHKAGYVHWDVKLDNFLLKENGVVILADFGLSTPRDEENVFFTENMLTCGNHRAQFDKESAKDKIDTYGFSTIIKGLLAKFNGSHGHCNIRHNWVIKIDEIYSRCSEELHGDRPHMEQVLQELEALAKMSEGLKCGVCSIL